MLPARGYENLKVAVLGLGRSGLAAARALAAGGAETLVWDDAAEARAAAEREGLRVAPMESPDDFEGVACLIVSPGVAHLHPTPHRAALAAMQAGVPLDNDIGVFFRSLAADGRPESVESPKVVAVTGSNGKSTTSALIAHILDSAGREVQLAGNIGRGALDVDPPAPGGIVVLELSSYQTELARTLAPDVAVFTNLSPDHLDRHAGPGGYFAAKRRLFAVGAPETAVIGVDETEGLLLAAQAGGTVIRVSVARGADLAGWSVCAADGVLTERRGDEQEVSIDLRPLRSLSGAHNHQNACCAYAACRALGLGSEAIAQGLAGFVGLPHRSEVIAESGGVVYVNDSKATNVEAARRALQAHDRIRWICGGLAKEGGLGALAPELGRVAKAYVIGRDAAQFALGLEGADAEICTTMKAAVARAMEDACPGETVLLAPAAASFDQYDSFERRGEDFAACVREGL